MVKFVVAFCAIGIMAGGFGLSFHSVTVVFAMQESAMSNHIALIPVHKAIVHVATRTPPEQRHAVHHKAQPPVAVTPTQSVVTPVPTRTPQKPIVVKKPHPPAATQTPVVSGSHWYLFPLSLQYGDSNASGYEHGVDVGTPPNTPITALLPGTITDLSSPGWGRQITWELDTPLHGAAYMYQIHLAALNPQLVIGSHIAVGTTVGWSGGAYTESQMLGTTNPTGVNYLDSSTYTSGPHTEIGLTGGPVYGSGDGYPLYPSSTYDIRGFLNALRG